MRTFLVICGAVLLAFAFAWSALYIYFVQVRPLRPRAEAALAQLVRQYGVHPVQADEIPAFFRHAVIATEDRRFAWDPGIDPLGILRSLLVDVERDGYVEGGSTITQQLADNLLLHSKEKTIGRKLRQVFYAIGLYDVFSKQEVWTMYCNVVYFGHGAYGLYNAAQTYFARPPWSLNPGELALLAGLPNAPSVYDPLRHFSLARARERVVLDNMVDAGMLTQAEAAAVYRQPIRLRFGVAHGRAG
ncbi:hypothetical protein GCM10010885_19200 [Alicyclobacillus cellulosilyticus]|uniref:Glycosyl transferase family 51 domain-containing protein n=1 Tax=Alicyclobacillus cellulosilyticus TaxID=1003997 RepID=A0A917KEC7_9BACL|nr:biosynthetic peptidoglycan transglycosylase [Alicyclobacillus cellulosilyticus]GGJ10173.1 hypothetical protein GCM10010885_19200 [Alicyclobacillus cellulosilyticus]